MVDQNLGIQYTIFVAKNGKVRVDFVSENELILTDKMQHLKEYIDHGRLHY